MTIFFKAIQIDENSLYGKLGVSKDTELMAAMICQHKGIKFTIADLREKGVSLYD